MSDQIEAEALVTSGQKYYSKKAYDKALENWQTALQYYQQKGEKRQQGIINDYISQALKALGRKKEALVSSTKGVRLLRETQTPLELRQALIHMSRIMQELGYREDALQPLSQALEIQIPQDDIKHRIDLLFELATAFERMGLLNDSYPHLAEAVTLAEKSQDPNYQSEALTKLARVLRQLKKFDDAQNYQEKLIQLWSKAGEPVRSTQARLGLASLFIAQGEFDQAETTLQEIQEALQVWGDKSGEPLVHYYLAQTRLHKGQLEEALGHAWQALKFYQKTKNKQAQARSTQILAQILDRSNEEAKAVRVYDQAIKLYSEVGDQAGKLQTQLMKGKTLLRQGSHREAEKEFTQVIHYYREHKLPEKEVQIYIEVASSLLQHEKFAEAREQVKLAIQQLQSLDDETTEIRAFRILVQTLKEPGDFEEDIPLLQQALERAKNQNKAALASSLTVILTQLSDETISPEESVGLYEKAVRDTQLPQDMRAEAVLNLSNILMKEGKYVEAAQHLSQAIKDFRSQPNFKTGEAYYQLSKAYKELNKPELQKQALQGALANLTPDVSKITEGELQLELALLLENDEVDNAIQSYSEAATIFEAWEISQKLFDARFNLAKLYTAKGNHSKAMDQVEKVLLIAEELDIPIDYKPDQQLSFKHLIQGIEISIFVASNQFGAQKQKGMIDKILDWSTRRKVCRLFPFLTENLGLETCPELTKLLQEENKLNQQLSGLRQNLAKLPRTGITHEEFVGQQEAIRKDLDDLFSKRDVNRNVIAAACIDPGRGVHPRDYQVLQKLIALMPPDRRWILINYDLLVDENRIIVTMNDHVGRYGNYTLPISADTISLVAKLRQISEARKLPPLVELKDIGSHLYRALIPSRLQRVLENQTYGHIQFVTDSFLHHVPFELTFDGQEYWGLKYPMAWIPNLQILESTLKARALAQTTSPSTVLGVYMNPDADVARKAIAEETAQAFISGVPTTKPGSEPIVLFGRDFTRTLLASSTDQPRSLIFFSTPTTIHHRMGEIKLMEPDSLRIIELGVTTNFKGAPILILDESFQVEPREDGLSLASFLRHLITAGASSLVFTRWRPDPKMQSNFAASIIRRLYEGDPIAVALMHTRRKLASVAPTPQSWLAYSLCGNPFTTLTSQ